MVRAESGEFRHRFEATRFVSPEDALEGTLMFSGKLLYVIDEAAAIPAVRYARAPLATASMDALEFHAPIRVGDMITLRGALNRVGTRSMEIGVQVLADGATRHAGGERLLPRHHTALLSAQSADPFVGQHPAIVEWPCGRREAVIKICG